MTEVRLHRLRQSYRRGEPAVVDLDLTAPPGQITALLGPSGCGKTTVLKMIAGLLTPDEGDITFDGRSVLAVPPERRGAVMVFQSHLLFPHMTAGENVAFGLRMRGEKPAAIRPRVEEMLERVRLPGLADRRPRELSGGQRQRVALARALIVEPRVLLLDEPLSNLDAHLRGEMRDLIFDLQREAGITTIVVTHDQEEAVILADRVALIFRGRLRQVDEPGAFYERPATEAIARFFGGVNFAPGVKRGETVTTALGVFRHEVCHLPDGPVTLTIRPENIVLEAAEDGAENAVSGRAAGSADAGTDARFPAMGGGEANVVAGRVASHVYAGTHTRFRVAVAAGLPPLEVIADAASQRCHRDGDGVRLRLPAAKIWLLPGAADRV